MSKRQPIIDMSWQKFSKFLLDTGDLDPVYIMLTDAECAGAIDERTLKRFMLAYWCYYSCGVAARIAESKDYWSAMKKGITDKWPRGMERRYFYSKTAWATIDNLQQYGSPEKIVTHMCAHTRFQDVSDAVQEFYGFGPWMGWKIADMAERVLNYPVDFSDSELGIYKDPVQGAAFIRWGDRHHPITLDELHETCECMTAELKEYDAPPHSDRPVNIQEIETVLCKYKAHCYGAYPLWNDTTHIEKCMAGWGDLAQELRCYMPMTYDWNG